jgi:RND family efflux transporter MFP subunit
MGRDMRGARWAAAVLWLVLAGCEEEPPAAEPIVRPIKMLVIGASSEGTREYPGRIRAGQQIDMAFEVQGRIIEWVFAEGDRVQAGALLARLDPRDYKNELEKARAAQRQAQTYLDRIAQAHETRAVADQDLTNAQAQLEVAEAEVKIRLKAVEDTELRAPFDGYMSRKLVEDFANVQAKEPVLVFEDPTRLEIKISVPERDLAGRRRPGETLEERSARIRPEVVVSALPHERFPARLSELASTADPTTRTYQATFVFEPRAETVVLPGMTAKVIVHVGTDGGAGEIVIPAHAAVADDAGRATVWLVDPDSKSVRRRPVTLGELRADSVVVTEGLASGDVVAISGVTQLRDGMVVRRWEP